MAGSGVSAVEAMGKIDRTIQISPQEKSRGKGDGVVVADGIQIISGHGVGDTQLESKVRKLGFPSVIHGIAILIGGVDVLDPCQIFKGENEGIDAGAFLFLLLFLLLFLARKRVV